MTVQDLSAVPPDILQAIIRSKQDAELGQWVENQFKACKQLRRDVERQWYINMAFYFGRQYIQSVRHPSTSAITFTVPPAPPWRVRLVVNRVRPIIRTEIAKLTAQKPTAYVIPASNEDEDKSAARAGEQIWESTYRDKELAKLLRRCLWWGVILGNSFIKEYWDATIGPVVLDPQTGLETPSGDIAFEIVPPFYLFVPDLLCEEIEDQPFVIHSTVKTVDDVYRLYGIQANSNRAVRNELIETKFLDIIGETTTMEKDGVLVHEMWIKPNGHKYFPQGGMLTVINGQVVQRFDQYPYPHGMYPFSKFDHVQTGKFYSDSVVTDLVPLQRELNRTRSQIIEAKNLASKPQLLAQEGAVNPRKITSEPGQVITYKPGMQPPTPLPLQSLPPYVLQEVDRLVQDMDDVSGQHEITRGQNPSQVTAYSALSYLQEQDESKLAASVASVEEFMEKLARLCLKYAIYYWSVPRTIRMVGRDKSVDVMHWKGSDLRGNTDIRVEPGSAIPLGTQQKRAFLIDLFKLGAIDPSMLLDLLDMNDINDVNQEYLVDKQQAQRENMLLNAAGEQMDPQALRPSIDPMTGQEIPPSLPPQLMPHSYDNHEAHILHHNNYRKSQEFDMAPDAVKVLFEMHVTSHLMALQGGMAPTVTSATGDPSSMVIPGSEAQQTTPSGQEPAPPGGNTTTESNTQPQGQGN